MIQELAKKLTCTVKTNGILKRITIRGLPSSLLEEELKSKLPIELGLPVNVYQKVDELLTTIKARTATYLQKNGFYGANVVALYRIPECSRTIEFTIEINGGVFALVNSVKVVGDAPISVRTVMKQFKRMCLRFDKIVEVISLGTFSCYSKELERQAVLGLKDRFG